MAELSETGFGVPDTTRVAITGHFWSTSWTPGSLTSTDQTHGPKAIAHDLPAAWNVTTNPPTVRDDARSGIAPARSRETSYRIIGLVTAADGTTPIVRLVQVRRQSNNELVVQGYSGTDGVFTLYVPTNDAHIVEYHPDPSGKNTKVYRNIIPLV